MGQQPSSSLQCALALWWSFVLKMVGQPMAQYGRGSRYGAVGCVVIVCACPRSDAMGGEGDRRRFSARQTAGRSRQIGTDGKMTDKQTGREVGVDSSRARRETGTK